MSSYYNVMKLEINNRNKFGDFTDIWKLNKTLLNIQWSNRKHKCQAEITRSNRKHFMMNK